ncbi:hypothetical protein FF011L_07750 [Roseimaritima multifibrata]|uniref:Glycosyltransferase RgtA/B/C/D-like domain-containing protein n=1 Tax=Roseimaritima multifibrata TaxID=1930274 RepID=A0A517MAX6_9BACT|nr:hypothetical protein [Roseimaritima multifibrata]QDS92039.1 hypothetical protein FF011L_07750 [Roseimaritima multifibrata]
MPAATSNSANRWLHYGILVLLALAVANLLAWRSIEPDLWGHIQYGEDWIHAGAMPTTASHTYSTPDHPWVNHENLFELAVAVGQRTLGGLGLMVLKCAAGLWLLWLMIRSAAAHDVPMVVAAVAMLPVAAGLGEFWLMRPQLFSFLFCGVLLFSLDKAFRNWQSSWSVDWKWLILCVPVMVLWTNAHGGFAAGLCVLLAVLGLRGIEFVLHRRKITKHHDDSTTVPNLRTLLYLGCIGLASIAAIFVNPYGWELPYWMWMSLKQPRPEVSEWATIFEGGGVIVPFFTLCILSIVATVWTKQKRDWVQIVVLGLIAVQAIGHLRHLAFFAIAFGFWMPVHIHSLWQQIVKWRPSLGQSQETSPLATRLLIGEFLLVAGGLAGILGYTFANFGVDRSKYPVSAFEYMADEQLEGRLVVTFNWAQYALAALAPTTTVGFDGRYDTCYPQTVVDMNFDLLFGQDLSRRHRGPDSGPVDSNRVLEFGNPNLVLLDRIADPPAVQHLEQHPDWVPLYMDGLAGLWGRRTVYDDPSKSTYLPPERRHLSDVVPAGIAHWPGFPDRTGKHAFSPDVATAVAAQRQQANDVSIQLVKQSQAN